jgi:hypothetical protein
MSGNIDDYVASFIEGKIADAVKRDLDAEVVSVAQSERRENEWTVLWFRVGSDWDEYGTHKAYELDDGVITLVSGNYFPLAGDTAGEVRRLARQDFAERAGLR